ncbi:sugar translocase [Agaribacter marinus]|uniref:Sugar translocase n=1 Tax=Virgibacillus salarius TaxID=447199 RepID=A0A941IBQ3_9BACI|nr:sugar translocase [Virgibacillus salarius]MBR7796666.1 sugar translocase [Virgibacillus salarius]NAZ09376.1 sugar translocase [Agaribacter marinus]
MRIENSIRNMFFGVSGQVISLIMGMIVRTVFIYTLGIEYVGVEGLFSSVLLILSLTNLGFDTAMIYSLYKPLAEKDTIKIQAYMNLFKKAYRIIGAAVCVIGLLLLPFLPYLLNGDTRIDHLNAIYLLFLLQSVMSYYFVHKQAIIIADQRHHIISKIHSVFIVMTNLCLIVLLLTTKNYIVVLSTQVAFRVMENVYIARKANQLYPFLMEGAHATLPKKDRKQFFSNLYALFLYKISGVVIHGADNIIISVFAGIAFVGMYANYLLIISTITTLLGYLFHSITASVGNLHVEESAEKKYFIFRVIRFTNFWIFGFCAICLWNLFNPFITVWLGDEYVLNMFIVFAIILNFFTAGMQNATTTFRETTGLFRKGKYRPIIAAGINILVSIILAKEIGLAGVFIGTVISRWSVYFWYDPYILFRYVFFQPVRFHFIRYMVYTLIVVIAAIITDFIARSFFTTYTMWTILFRGTICIFIPNVLFYLLFRKTEEFNYLYHVAKRIVSTKLMKHPVVEKTFSHK